MRDIGAARRGKAWHSEYGTARGPRSELLSHLPPPPPPPPFGHTDTKNDDHEFDMHLAPWP